MKKKSKNAHLKRKKEFRLRKINVGNKKIKHPAYVFLEMGNVYIFVNLTHSKEIKNKIVLKLKKNPNPKDNADSYYVEENHEDTKINLVNDYSIGKWTPMMTKTFENCTKKDDSVDGHMAPE